MGKGGDLSSRGVRCKCNEIIMGKYAVITMTHNGGVFMRLWLNYYRKYFDDKDIYIIDHGSDDGSITDDIKKRHNIVHVPFHGYATGDFITQHVQFLHNKLQQTGKYKYIIVGDIDEIVVADPLYFKDIVDYLGKAKDDHITVDTRSPIHMRGEPPIDLDKPILGQRRFWISEENVEKPCINKKTPFWTIGFHWQYDPEMDYLAQDYHHWPKSRYNQKLLPKNPDPRIFLVHIERIDFQILEDKRQANKKYRANTEMQWRHKFLDDEEFKDWFYGTNEYAYRGIGSRPVWEIPVRFKKIL